jgi:hypothetical protein
MKLLLSLLIAFRAFHAFQAGTLNDVNELRQMLGFNYRSVLNTLNARNQVILRNTQSLAPQQAAQMRSRMTEPAFPEQQLMLPLNLTNIGQGLALYVFEHDFTVEQINLYFCPAQPAADNQPARSEQVVAIQVLLDDSLAPEDAVSMFQSVYRLPPPAPFERYEPAATYPVVKGLPAVAWDLGPHEGIYQSVLGNSRVTGQLWLADKNLITTCAKPPKLTP